MVAASNAQAAASNPATSSASDASGRQGMVLDVTAIT
jgi:hypothetical protein